MRKHFRGVVLAIALTLCGCSDRYGDAANYAALAQAQFDAGNLPEARESIQRAIIARDDVAEYFVLLAQIELASNQAVNAFNAYSRALDLQADNVTILQSIAELGLQTDRVAEADEAADRMLLLSPDSPRALLVKGFVAIERRRYKEAAQFAAAILKANPDDQGGIILSARLSAIEGKFDEAIAMIDRGLSAAPPDNAAALDATLLEIYRAQANAEGMQRIFPRVVTATSQVADYQIDYANFLYKTGNLAAARKQVLAIVDERPNDSAALGKLSRLFIEYDPEPLAPAQLSALSQTGTRTTQLAFGRFYLSMGALDKALKAVARPLAERVPDALALAARIRLAQGQGSEARRLAASVLAEDPRQPDALLARSAFRLAAGQADAAIEDANIVVSDAPQEYAGYIALAKGQLAKGSKLRGRQVFEEGINMLPQDPLLAAAYESFLRQEGDTARVVSLYAGLAAASPSSTRAAKAYMRVCAEFGSANCRFQSDRLLTRASRSFMVDEAPGAPKARGLFSRITPEQVCKATGGVCTAS